MKKSEVIKSIIEIVINYEGCEAMEELEYLFGELRTAKIIEGKEKNV